MTALLAPPVRRLMLESPSRARERRPTRALLDRYARRINVAHVGCVQAEGEALHHAIRAGRLLLEVKELVGHGNFIPWIRQHCRFEYDTALSYKSVAEWIAANPERARYLKSIRQVLEARRQDRAARLRTVRLQLTGEEWSEFWGFLSDLGATSEPVPTILRALEELLARRDAECVSGQREIS